MRRGFPSRLSATMPEKTPLLGVCLGHQAIARAFGATIVRAAQVMHGKTSLIEHNGEGCFRAE